MKKKLIAMLSMLTLLVGATSCDLNTNRSSVTAKDGVDDKDGSSILTGQGAPYATLGNDGDSYIDTTTWDYYTKSSGVWTKVGNIKGEDGDEGAKGDKGDKGDAGEAGKDASVAIYTVRYYAGNKLLKTQQVTNGSRLTAPTSNETVGYVIEDWKYEGESWVFTGKNADRVFEDIDLYATYYNQTNTYTLDPGEGTCSTSTISLTYGSPYSLPTPTFTTDSAAYEFAGWYLDDTKIEQSGNSWAYYKDDFTLNALWTGIDAYVLDAAEGNCSTKYMVINYAESYSLPTPTFTNTDTQEGLFLGWYIGDTLIANTGTWSYNGDERKITAKWKITNFEYFGSYPQSKVIDASLTKALTKEIGLLPTSSNFQNWTSYKYYINGSNETDFMWYQDVEYTDGNKYRGVYFTSYRPSDCSSSSSENDSNQYSKGYRISTIYWFKYEPIKMRILESSNNDKFYVTDKIIDSQQYYHESDYTKKTRAPYDSTTTASVYDNNYQYSDIRGWLNTDFYNTAFSSTEQSNITTTEVDNSVASTGDASNSYTCDNTNDKLFLLSYSEATNTSYFIDNDERRASATAYAYCQGYSWYYWLRSPIYSYYARYVSHNGDIHIRQCLQH